MPSNEYTTVLAMKQTVKPFDQTKNSLDSHIFTNACVCGEAHSLLSCDPSFCDYTAIVFVKCHCGARVQFKMPADI